MEPSNKSKARLRLSVALLILTPLCLTTQAQTAMEALRRARIAPYVLPPAEAAKALAEAAGRWPQLPALWMAAGEQAMEAGNFSVAVDYLSQAVSAEGDADLQLAEAQRQAQDYPAAMETLSTLTRMEAENAEAHYQLGLLLTISDPSSANAELDQAADLDEDYAEAATTLKRAIRNAQQAEDPSYASMLIGQALGSVGAWDLAATAFREAINLVPSYAEAWAYLGEAQYHLGEDGLEALQTALELNPDSLSANIFLGLYWQRKSQPNSALEYLDKAASLDPQNPVIQAEMGRAYQALGDLPATVQHYQQAAELAPRDPNYWLQLAEFAIDNEIYLWEVGLPAARQARDLNPEDPAALVLLGRIFFLFESEEPAVRFLQKALDADPAYAPAHLYLGWVYLAYGQGEEAEEQLNLALNQAPDNAIGEQAQRLLEANFPEYRQEE